MNKQLVFIDDSGDPGFKEGASSNNFIIASAVFADQEIATEVNRAISDFRHTLGWQDETEFKFRKTNKHIVARLLNIVSTYNFQIYAVYIDKTNYKQMPPVFDKEKLYNWTVKELLKIIPLNNAYIKIDGRSTKEHQRRISSYLRHEINVSERKIKEIRPEDSIKDNLIQLADIIAGSINRSMQPEKTDSKKYFSTIKKKVVLIKRLDLRDK